jgi:hypothetical protein
MFYTILGKYLSENVYAGKDSSIDSFLADLYFT